MDFMIPIYEVLINDQFCLLKKSEEIHNRLIEVVLKGQGLPSISQTLSQLAGNPVLIADRAGNVLANTWPAFGECEFIENWDGAILTHLEENRGDFSSLKPHRWHKVELTIGDIKRDLVIAPVKINGNLQGYLAILEICRVLDEQDLRALEHASTIVALDFVKEKAVFEAERQIRGELLEDLIGGNFQYDEAVIKRASYLNFNINTRLVVFVLDIDGFESYLMYKAKRDEGYVQELKAEILQLVHNALLDYPGGAMLLAKSDSVTGLVHLPSRNELAVLTKKFNEIISKMAAKLPKLEISAGIGRPFTGVRNVKYSYDEALASLRIGRSMQGLSKITFFEELGPYRFLYELKDSLAMQDFYQETLGKLITYDGQNNTELMKTLFYYFKHDCNLRVTSENLYIHKNSVIYRIKN
ncbi:hypothetical protein N752_01420 [Desulforamulus aquiferis]|nr:helix-turn-helix domain-containing protein [Desulforamulus aquiferis]RYD06979.1 hypothetical protein N752_01420 [Desulforamulus aquiferis]